MVTEKTLHFTGKNKDLNNLSNAIVRQLQSDGCKTQMRNAPIGTIIQPQKAGILRDIIAADRAFAIVIAGDPNDFSIHIGNWQVDSKSCGYGSRSDSSHLVVLGSRRS